MKTTFRVHSDKDRKQDYWLAIEEVRKAVSVSIVNFLVHENSTGVETLYN